MGLWGVFSGRRRDGLNSKLRDYDHSVGFTLNTDDQFTLEVPNQNGNEAERESFKIVGVHVPIAYSFSSVMGDKNNDSGSTVSSITTNSTDSESSTDLMDTIEADFTLTETRTEDTGHDEGPSLFASLLDLCGYGTHTDTDKNNDWCPPKSDVRTTPSDKSDPILADRKGTKDHESPHNLDSTAAQIFNMGQGTADCSSSPNGESFSLLGIACCAIDKYAVADEPMDKKKIREIQRAQRIKKREERRAKRKAKKEAKAMYRVEVVSHEPIGKKASASPKNSKASKDASVPKKKTNTRKASNSPLATKKKGGFFKSFRKKKAQSSP